MMRRHQVLVFVAAAAAAAWPLAIPGGASALAAPAVRGAAVPVASSWGRAIEVPGLAALNKGGLAGVNWVSCGSADNCTVGGDYTDGERHQQGFVAIERRGRWDLAIKIPGLAALNKGGNADVTQLSCTSARNCAIGGSYTDGERHQQGFVATEKSGRWGQAIELPGLEALNKGGNAGVDSVWCTSAGNCAASGNFRNEGRQGFVATEKNGRWAQAIEVPGLGALNEHGDAETYQVSCAAAGDCAAGGYYTDAGGNSQGFVVSEQNGRWAQAIEVPGLGPLNAGHVAAVLSVSCGADGNCAAGGDYTDSGDNQQGFVVSEKNGVWGRAIDPRGLEALNDSGDAEVSSISCPSAGNCEGGGDYYYGYDWGFVVGEKNGAWGRAINVPGIGAVVTGRFVDVLSVSCHSAGNCAVSGDFEDLTDAGSLSQGFVVTERNGVWGQAVDPPGLHALNSGGGAAVVSVSCGSASNCAAGGNYTDRRGHQQGFVVSER